MRNRSHRHLRRVLFGLVLTMLFTGCAPTVSLTEAPLESTSVAAAQEEPLPVFDAAEYEIKRIVVDVDLPVYQPPQFTVHAKNEALEAVVGYLNAELSSRGVAIRATVGRLPAMCRAIGNNAPDDPDKGEAGTLYGFVGSAYGFRGLPAAGFIIFEPCIGQVGPMRLSYPEDWSAIDPEPNIRRGDCAYFPSGKLSEIVLCRAKPDVDLIIYQIAGAKGGRSD